LRKVRDMVREFHEKFNLPAPDELTEISTDRIMLRMKLIDEERDEVEEEMYHGTLATIAKELGDLVYVAYGAALEYGVDLDPVIEEIHRSNLTKLGDDGKPIVRWDGKVLKGPHYEEADIASVIGQNVL
jgi:predicted HAD superfamily Cof-like phosphohydrolase